MGLAPGQYAEGEYRAKFNYVRAYRLVERPAG
jgi:hypothetical protein